MDVQSVGFDKELILRNYKLIEEVGSGVYGTVYKALSLKTREIVALKHVRYFYQEDGFPISFYREVKYLKLFSEHQNIVKIKNIEKFNKNDIFLVLEYCETDLKRQFLAQPKMTASQVKHLIFQLLNGLDFLHSRNVAHRDIKPSNLLIKNGKILKIADFGLARELTKNMEFTSKVSSLAYRAPELLLGSTDYTTKVDIWSAGIIFYELATGESFPSGGTELSQLDKIFKITGNPLFSESLSKLPNWRLATMIHGYSQTIDQLLSEKLKGELIEAKPLIESMLQVEPEKRLTAKELLQTSFFTNIGPIDQFKFPQIRADSLNESVSSPRNPIIRPGRVVLDF